MLFLKPSAVPDLWSGRGTDVASFIRLKKKKDYFDVKFSIFFKILIVF